MTYQTVEYTRAVHRRNVTASKASIRKEENLKIRKLEKEHQTEFSRRKEGNNKNKRRNSWNRKQIRKIHERGNKCTEQRISKTPFSDKLYFRNRPAFRQHDAPSGTVQTEVKLTGSRVRPPTCVLALTLGVLWSMPEFNLCEPRYSHLKMKSKQTPTQGLT